MLEKLTEGKFHLTVGLTEVQRFGCCGLTDCVRAQLEDLALLS